MLNPILALQASTELNEDVELQSLLALAASEFEDNAHLYLPHLETATQENADELSMDELRLPVLQVEEAELPELQPIALALSEIPLDLIKEDNFKSLPIELKKIAEERAKHALREGRVKCNEESIKRRIEKEYPKHVEAYLAYYKELLLIGSKDIDKKSQVSALAKKRGTDMANKALDINKLYTSAGAEFGDMAEFYCSIYRDAFETARLKKAKVRKTAEQNSPNNAFKDVLTDVKKVATDRACRAFNAGRIIFSESHIRRVAEKKFPEHVGAYLAYYKEALEIKCKDIENKKLICRLANSRGRALAIKSATLHIYTLKESAMQFGDLAELYYSTYRTAFYAQRLKIDQKKCESQDTSPCLSDIEETCELQQMSNPNNFLPSYKQGSSKRKPESEMENRSTSKCGI
jgi:hypothetical protein